MGVSRPIYQATEPLCGPVCAGISALPTESFVSIERERETEPVDRNKPIFQAISYRPRWSYPMILSPRTRYRIDLSSHRIWCFELQEMQEIVWAYFTKRDLQGTCYLIYFCTVFGKVFEKYLFFICNDISGMIRWKTIFYNSYRWNIFEEKKYYLFYEISILFSIYTVSWIYQTKP